VLAAIREAGPGEGVLLHGCCHNPTGIDYTLEEWEAIAGALEASGTFPIIDTAYQGLGHGLEEDVAGLRAVLERVPEALIAYSCDKNFGMYRDRVGALYVLADGKATLETAFSNANALARASWSMPPDHGGAAVRLVLRDTDLTEQWLEELGDMRARIRKVRATLAEAGMAGSVDLTPLGAQNGLFSILPLTKEHIAALREQHGIYMAGSGRINVAGLTMDNIDSFVAAIAKVTG
jgi:aromatic-amino-acid transaminase